jgi:Tol biopolymer transport system component
MTKSLNNVILNISLALFFTTSCSTTLNINNTSILKLNDKKTFGIKSSNFVQNTDLTYNGTWTENESIHELSGEKITVDNTDTSLTYIGNWLTYNNNLTSNSNYSYIHSALNQKADDISQDITYTKNNWLKYSLFTYNDVNYSFQTINHDNLSNNYFGTWLTWNNFKYSHSTNAEINIPFNGTNIQVFQLKSPLEGDCEISVVDENNNVERTMTVSLNNPSATQVNKIVINGLKNGNHTLKIKRLSGRLNFMQARVYPSIEYKFNGDNITYNAFKANNCGKVAVTIDNNPNNTQIIDLYNYTTEYSNVFSASYLESGEHTITIDSLGEKNSNSSGYRITLNEFKTLASVKGEFTGQFLNLKLVGTPNSGKADLYIDGIYNQTIDMYSNESSYYSVNINGLENKSHTFELKAKNEKNSLSTGTRINFDGYTTNKASYTFTGTGIAYFANKKNNQGMVDIWIDGNKYGTYDLYSETPQNVAEIVNITGLTNQTHTIEFIPSGIKKASSRGYNINIDYLIVDNSLPKKVLWYGYDGTTNHIYLANSDKSGGIVKLSSTTNDNWSPVISTNGSKAVWQGNYNIYVKDLYNHNEPIKLSTTTTNNGLPQISADGSKVVWSGRNEDTGWDIYIANTDGSGTPIKLSTTTSGNIYSQISADGTKVVWNGSNENLEEDIYITNSDGSSLPTKLSTTSRYNSSPRINANGSKVVWIGDNGEGEFHVYLYDLSTSSHPVKLSNLKYNFDPQISADGSKVVWCGNDETTTHIYLKDLNNNSLPIQLSSTSNSNLYPQISADGSKVVWSGYDGTGWHIYVANTDGLTPPIKLSKSGYNYNPQISADGSKVVWSGDDGTGWHIYVANTDGLTLPVKLSTDNIYNNSLPQISN